MSLVKVDPVQEKEYRDQKKQRKKLSENRKGKHLSEEHKQKISKGNKGKVISKETRLNISRAKKGKPSPLKGKPNGRKGIPYKEGRVSSRKGRPAWNRGIPRTSEVKQKLSICNTGKRHTEESIQKMSIVKKGKPSKLKSRPGTPHTEEWKYEASLRRKAYLRSPENTKIRFKRSRPEIEFGIQVENLFGVILPHSKHIEGRVFDYCYELKKILIECDDTYWHNLPKQRKIDLEKNEIAKNNGYTLIRCELNDTKEVVPFIKEHYEELKQIFESQG